MPRCVLAIACLLALPAAAMAERPEKEYCCWKIVVKASGEFLAQYDGGEYGLHGPYRARWRWETRNLMRYTQRTRRYGFLHWFSSSRGAYRYSLRETAEQTRQNFDIEPCDRTRETSGFKRDHDSSHVPIDDLGDFPYSGNRHYRKGKRVLGVSVPIPSASESCDAGAPGHDADQYDEGVRGDGDPHDSFDDMWGPSRYYLKSPRRRKLRRHKPFSLKFEQSVAETHDWGTGDERFNHTSSGSTRVVARFTWFPKDDLKRQRRNLTK